LAKEAVNPANRQLKDRDRPRTKDDTSISEVHAEGHFRRRLSTLKMLLSGHLHEENSILTDQNTPPARFCLFGKGKILWEIGRFCAERLYQNETHGDVRPGCPVGAQFDSGELKAKS
jgi:hypothetical protein